MGFINFGIYYLIRVWRENKRRRRRQRRSVVNGKKADRVKNGDIERVQNNDIDVVDGIVNEDINEDIATYKRPLLCRLILIWSIVEIFLLLIVLIKKPGEEYPENFLYQLCDRSINCKTVLPLMIYYKMLSALFLGLGAKTVSYNCNVSTFLNFKMFHFVDLI